MYRNSTLLSIFYLGVLSTLLFSEIHVHPLVSPSFNKNPTLHVVADNMYSYPQIEILKEDSIFIYTLKDVTADQYKLSRYFTSNNNSLDIGKRYQLKLKINESAPPKVYPYTPIDILLSPIYSFHREDDSIQLQWYNPNHTKDFSYQIELSKSHDFESSTTKKVNNKASITTTLPFKENTHYYLRVTGESSLRKIIYSQVIDIIIPSEKEAIPLPINSDRLITDKEDITLRWRKVKSDNSRYNIELSRNNSFTDLYISTFVSDTVVLFNNININSSYIFWRVKPDRSNTWSFIDSFAVQSYKTPKMVRHNGKRYPSTKDVVLSWEHGSFNRDSEYTVTVSNNRNFLFDKSSDDKLTKQSYLLDKLDLDIDWAQTKEPEYLIFWKVTSSDEQTTWVDSLIIDSKVVPISTSQNIIINKNRLITIKKNILTYSKELTTPFEVIFFNAFGRKIKSMYIDPRKISTPSHYPLILPNGFYSVLVKTAQSEYAQKYISY